jgi:nucleoside-specific outer membrane channel protein Tsx
MRSFLLSESCFWLFLVASVALPSTVHAADWSDSEIQFLHGSSYREPFNPDDVAKNIITIQHADGHAYGRNFFFVDILKSDGQDEHAREVYAEGYASFSLSKLTGHAWSWGPVRDVNLTAGINYGYKDYPHYGVNPRVLLPGVTVDFNFPGFAFFNVDILSYIDRGRFDGHDNGCNDETWLVTPAWSLPFSLGSAKFSFDGFVDIIGSHGNCHQQVQTQPQLRWDVGNHFDHPGKIFVGIEYQYWHNKFGIRGLQESLPQALLVWKF